MSDNNPLLELLVCPETHEPLKPAPPELLEELNARVADKALTNHAGRLVEQPLQAGLLRDDAKALYRVDDELPNMLIEERIDL